MSEATKEKSNLPAVRPEVGSLTDIGPELSLVPVKQETLEEAVTLWSAKWDTMQAMKPEDLRKVAAVILGSFPYLGPVELTTFFDVLGGKIYPNEQFWQDSVARHPMNDGFSVVVLKPETEEWDEWIGASMKSDQIAAAYLCRVRRKDRAEPIEEASYVSKTDALICEFTYRDFGTNKEEAEKAAKEQIPEGAVLDRFWFKKAWQNQPAHWAARYATLKPDWEAIAKKKARSTAARRTMRKAYSLSEARVSFVLRAAEERLPQPAQIASETPEVQPTAAAPAKPSTSETARPAPTGTAALISENDRRKMFAWANEREFPEGVTLKTVISKVTGVPEEEVSTKQVTNGQLLQVREALEQYPAKGQKAPAEETMEKHEPSARCAIAGPHPTSACGYHRASDGAAS